MLSLRESVAALKLPERLISGPGAKYKRSDLGITREGIVTPPGSRFPSQEDLTDQNAQQRLWFVVADDNLINRKVGAKAIKDEARKLGYEAMVKEGADQIDILNAVDHRGMTVGRVMNGVLTDCEMPSKRLPGNSDGGIAYLDEMDDRPWMRPHVEIMTTTRKDVGPESSTKTRSIGALARLLGPKNENLDTEKKIKQSAQSLVQRAIEALPFRNREIVAPASNPRRSAESTYSAMVRNQQKLETLSMTSSRRRANSDTHPASPFVSPSLSKAGDVEAKGGFFVQSAPERESTSSVATTKRTRAETVSNQDPLPKRSQLDKPAED